MRVLTPDYIAALIAEEAAAGGLRTTDNVRCRVDGPAALVRFRVWRRAMRETGASAQAIAELWGYWSASDVAEAVATMTAESHLFSDADIARCEAALAWHYAETPPAERHARARRDLAAWDRLGEKAAA